MKELQRRSPIGCVSFTVRARSIGDRRYRLSLPSPLRRYGAATWGGWQCAPRTDGRGQPPPPRTVDGKVQPCRPRPVARSATLRALGSNINFFDLPKIRSFVKSRNNEKNNGFQSIRELFQSQRIFLTFFDLCLFRQKVYNIACKGQR